MNNHTKRMILLGAICILLVIASSCYTIAFNDSRFIVPMDLSEYVFRVQDLPMLISGILVALYIFYLFVLLAKAVIANKKNEQTATRTVDSRWGFLGFLGFAGSLGFWTYSIDKTVFPFMFFIFFGFFGFFYEGKMSYTFMDERYRENKSKASAVATKIAFTLIFLELLILSQGKLIGNLEYTLIAFIILTSLSIALKIFLNEYLLYHYDHDEIIEESGE